MCGAVIPPQIDKLHRKQRSLRSRRLEVVGTRKNGRARRRHARVTRSLVSPVSPVSPVLSFARYQAPATQARNNEKLLKQLFRACISCTFPVTWRRLPDEHVLVQRSKQSQPLNPPIMTPIIRRYPRPGRIFGDLLLFCIVRVEMCNLHVWMGRDKYTSSVQ